MEELDVTTNDEILMLDSDSTMESYFGEDAYKTFWFSIKNYPILSSEENKKLALESQAGNFDARDKLVKCNLRLVAWVANKYKNRISHMQILDIIQEGTIGLMKSIDTFNPEKGAFSTNAINWIKQTITRSISNNEDDIRLPVYLDSKIREYLKIVEECDRNNRQLPSDEDLCAILDISASTLYNIKNHNYNTISINQKINQDDSEDELESFIGVEDNSYDEVIDRLSNETLFAVLKEILDHKQYFIIYYRYLLDEKKTLDDLAKLLGITKERVRQIENKALRKIKPYMVPDSDAYKKKLEQMHSWGQVPNWYDTKPVDLNKIILFMYIKDDLTDIETQIMYYSVLGKLKLEWYRVKLGLSSKEFNDTMKSISEKVRKAMFNRERFNGFKNSTLKNNGTKLFDISSDKFKLLDYDYLKNIYGGLSFEEIMKLYEDYNIKLTDKDTALLDMFFKKIDKKTIRQEYIEKDIYLLSFGCKSKKNKTSLKKLYKVFCDNIQEFDEEQVLVLECYYFNLKRKTVFREKYPNSLLYRYCGFLIDKLERMYYGINEMFENSFNKEKYLFVKEKYSNRLTLERIKLLDLFYGVNGRVYSIVEIAEIFDEDYVKMHDKIRHARNYCISLYNNRTSSLIVDLSKYKDYILSKNVDLTEETRYILKLYIIDELDYESINKLTGLSKYRISNIITEGIRKLDFYRYQIISVNIVAKEELEKFFEVYSNNFNDIERQIIFLKRVEIIDNDTIAERLKAPKNDVNMTVAKFNRLYLKFQIREVTLSKEEILEEINCHISESVIDDFSKEILSIYYGLKTNFNKEGFCLTSEEIKIKYKLTKDKFYKQIYMAIDAIKAKKIGILKNDLVYINRKELEIVLEDIHLPISEKEREIICYLFGLYGYPYKTLEELSKIYNDTKGSIKRRYQRAILSIYKYRNNEIEGAINYEFDIEPKLKYFSRSDSFMIEDYYKNHLTYKELSKKYSLSFDQIVSIFNRIKNTLFDYVHDDKKKMFDFEFYRKEKYNPELPFYGNRKLATQVFDLFFGEDNIKGLSIPEIINKLNLTNSQTTVSNMLSSFMLSFCKLRDGIVKDGFSYEEIQEYYNNNFMNMSEEKLRIYGNYFKRKNNVKIINGKASNVSDIISYDLLKSGNPDFFSMGATDRDEIFSILKKHFKNMSKSTREYLMFRFNISYRSLLNGREINHVYRLLDALDNGRNKAPKECFSLTRKKSNS